jgi:hypothetical protein
MPKSYPDRSVVVKQHTKNLNHPNQTMKQHSKWFVGALMAAGGLATVTSMQAQTYLLSNFQNFNLSATYGNWDVDGSSTFNGGSGYTPTITSGSTSGSFEVNAQQYGSGAYDFSTPVDATGANQFSFTFTMNLPTGGPYWMNPGLDISDGTHQVTMVAANPGASGANNYNNYTSGTYTLYGSLGDLNVADITAFNLEFDPAGYGGGAPYDITYNSLSLTTAPVPEPTTMAMLGLGAAGLVIARRRAKTS